MTGTVAATASRTGQHLAALLARYPHVVADYDRFRRGRGSAPLGTWPDWCYVPMAGAVVAAGAPAGVAAGQALEIGRVAALATWRLGRGIYRFDPALYAALGETRLPQDLPVAPLYRLPEWCLYLDLPGEPDVAGTYVHLEFDANTRRPELRLLLDSGRGWDGLLPCPLFLDEPTLAGVRRGPLPVGVAETAAELVDRVLSALLYLVSERAEIVAPGDAPARPSYPPTPYGRGPRQPRTWEVGYRIGATLRRGSTTSGERGGTGERAAPRPHLRRAHWHHYWTGPRADEQRTLVVHWLPPTLVAADDPDALVADVHQLRPETS